jgi:hypothetical protein
MIRKTLTFGEWRQIPPDKNGDLYGFPFSMVETNLSGQPRQRQDTGSHILQVCISQWIMTDSKCATIAKDIVRIAFGIALKRLTERAQKAPLKPIERVDLGGEVDKWEMLRFDLRSAQDPNGAIVQVDLPDTGSVSGRDPS